MLTNEQMTANRYGRWARARKTLSMIQDTLRCGGYVVVATMTRAWQYDARSIDSFKATRSSVYVRRGKQWDCIDYCGIQYHKPVAMVEQELMLANRDF